ncbi:MAG: N-acetyltransferase family protein [Betaproteobacteria bacterium]
MSRVAAGFSIREAEQADAAAIARVHTESWRTTYAGILPRELIARESGTKSELVWQRRLAHPARGAATWIAETRREGIVGFATCGEARDPIEGLDAEIYALYVIHSHQRRGVGRELVRACARHFVRQGLFSFYLWVLKANRARLFYDAIGGEEVATRNERLGLHRYDEIAYGWRDLTGLVTPD